MDRGCELYGQHQENRRRRDISLLSAYINLFAASLGVDPALRECPWRCDERNCPPPWERCSRFVHTPRQQQGETSPAVRCPSDVPVTSQLSRPVGIPRGESGTLAMKPTRRGQRARRVGSFEVILTPILLLM
jgi:hypothetical protein